MNKTMTITVIALVTVVMGMSAIAPAMAGHDSGQQKSEDELIEICHNGNTISVSLSSLPGHRAHGDNPFPCL